MSNYTLELIFADGKFVGQIWRYENLDIDNILYHYDYLPTIYLRDAEIFVHSDDNKFEISSFLKNYFSKPMFNN